MVSDFMFLWDSCVFECVCLHLYVLLGFSLWLFCFLVLFSCPILVCLFICLFYVPILKEKEREWICTGGDAGRIWDDSEVEKQ